jgi:TolA-binding protein
MAFLRRWLLILSALVLGCGQMTAAGTRENRDFAAAIGAFQDGMWSRAETGFDSFKNSYPDSTDTPQAVLLQAQAEFKQGKLTNAITLLADTNNQAKAGNLADQYFYWIGEAQFQNKNYSGAATTWIALDQKFSESPLRLRAVLGAAAAYVQLGGWQQTVALLEETNGVFQGTVRMDSANELVSRGRLLLAQAKFALKDLAGEFAVLASLNSQTLKPDLDWQRAYLLYQNRDAAGDSDAALAATTNLLEIARLKNPGGLLAESVAMHAGALEKSGLTNEAIAAYQENLTNSASAEQQRQAVLKVAELAIAQGRLPVATNALETFLAGFPGSAAADVAVLTLGELQLKNYAAQPTFATNDLLEAQTNFDQFIGTFTNSPLLGKAYLDRGWCEWLPEKNPGSSGDFAMAVEKLPFSEDLAVARFKLGDALFAKGDFAGARTNYEAVVDDFTNFPDVGEALGAQALYQLLRSCLELNDVGGASNSLARIIKIYPPSDLTTNRILTAGILITGEGLTDLGQPANALTLFQKFKELSPDSDLLPEVDLAMARAYEQEHDWPSAIGVYNGWLRQFGTNATLLPQVEYAQAWANFQAGDETNAYDLFTNFITKFSANGLAPVAQWWVGDHFFRTGDFVGAERNYEYVFQNWPESQLAYPAKIMAGRAAMGRGSYQDATNYFTSLTDDTNCPPDYDAQALFAYGDALVQMPSPDTNNPLANFNLAVAVFKTICQKYPANGFGARAWGEIGNCDYQLGDYVSATNAYSQVYFNTNSPADISARSQAQIGSGLALEKMAATATGTNQTALLDQALDNYLLVFDGQNLRGAEQSDPWWLKEAGLHAAPLVGMLNDVKAEKLFYKSLETALPQLADSIEKKIAALPPDKN